MTDDKIVKVDFIGESNATPRKILMDALNRVDEIRDLVMVFANHNGSMAISFNHMDMLTVKGMLATGGDMVYDMMMEVEEI